MPKLWFSQYIMRVRGGEINGGKNFQPLAIKIRSVYNNLSTCTTGCVIIFQSTKVKVSKWHYEYNAHLNPCIEDFGWNF